MPREDSVSLSFPSSRTADIPRLAGWRASSPEWPACSQESAALFCRGGLVEQAVRGNLRGRIEPDQLIAARHGRDDMIELRRRWHFRIEFPRAMNQNLAMPRSPLP